MLFPSTHGKFRLRDANCIILPNIYLCIFLGFVGVPVYAFEDVFIRWARDGHFPGWRDPGIPPPSFMYSSDQLWPPYDINVDVVDPRKRCDATQASLCGIKIAIQLVTRARWWACPELDAGGERREAALATLTQGNYSTSVPSSQGFDVFVFDKSNIILADPFRPQLVGEFLEGKNATGGIRHPTLKPYVDWVVGWGGGFVPHYSTRLQDGNAISVATYVEECPGSGDRVAVSLARQNTQLSECAQTSNELCAQRNLYGVHGKAMVEALLIRETRDFSSMAYKATYGDDFQAADFRVAALELSWYGYPGSHEFRNPAPLADNSGVLLVSGYLPRAIAWNDTDTSGTSESTLRRVSRIGNAAWSGGALTFLEPPVSKVVFVAGVVFNYTAMAVISGLSHAPREPVLGPLCSNCTASLTLPCSLTDAESLAVHAGIDIQIPSHGWDRLTYNKWFGASHEAARVDWFDGAASWSEGLYVAAYSKNGTCVAHGGDPNNVGKSSAEIYGNLEAHEHILVAASNGEGWATFEDNSVHKLAFVQEVVKDHEEFYILAAITRVWPPLRELERCSSTYLEECSNWNTQALLGRAGAEILSQHNEDDLLEVVQLLHSRAGPFSQGEVGNFQVHLYDEDFGCWSVAQAAGIPCPPELTGDQVEKIPSEIDKSWELSSVSITMNSTALVAYIFRISWMPHDEVTAKEFILVSYVGRDVIMPLCTEDSDCPSASKCSALGRCRCNSGHIPNVTFALDDCGRDLLPTEMMCVHVAGMDCTDGLGNVDTAMCRPCAEGYFCSSGLAAPCTSGQYCPPNSKSPIPCAPGSSTNSTLSRSCTPCEVGTATDQVASVSCASCLAGTFAGEIGLTVCRACPRDSYSSAGQAVCSKCPRGTFAEGVGATSIEECRHCADGYFFSGEGCEKCFWGLTAPESDATSCQLAPEMLAILPSILVLAMLTFILLRIFYRRYEARMRTWQQKAEAESGVILEGAVSSLEEFPFPLAIMNIRIYLTLPPSVRRTSYEGHRDAHRMCMIDSLRAYQEFSKSGKHIIFLSYPRTFSGQSGLPAEFDSCIQRALVEATTLLGWTAEDTFVFIDTISVPREHLRMRDLAFQSMYLHSKCADILLAVRPTIYDKKSELVCDAQSYHIDSCARAEVLSFCCGRGPEKVYTFDESGLNRASARWLSSLVHVFEGRCACCKKGHRSRTDSCFSELLVSPLLALFVDGLQLRRAKLQRSMSRPWVDDQEDGESGTSGLHFFQSYVLPEKDRILPANFKFSYTDGAGRSFQEVRPLFGKLLKRAEGRGYPMLEQEYQ